MVDVLKDIRHPISIGKYQERRFALVAAENGVMVQNIRFLFWRTSHEGTYCIV